ncbi:hypothetical protein MFIFM68171_05786 [Madurella fahalii]|uniref:Major facilitator superfamily (MFS) profile domain-containing protein n=1 Tax=Madurella fahalii TaxID=1157608 RepID=A0ABQ0GCU2_9PEZI
MAKTIERWGLSDKARIENPLAHFSDEELSIDARRFVNSKASFLSDKIDEVCRAAHVAKHSRFYAQLARGRNPGPTQPPVLLTDEEKAALRREEDKIISESGLWRVLIVVVLAAFLQGFVQSSFGGANVYEGYWRQGGENAQPHQVGIANGIPYLAAALIGCPLADPINQMAGRRGAIFIAAVLIASTSIAAACLEFDSAGTGNSDAWKSLVGIRLVNGVGMGLKAVSTPIIASETSLGRWRGSLILQWQLWVACGIFSSYSMNLLFFLATPLTTLRLILAAPVIPALMLMLAVYFVPESPRFYLRPHRGKYNPEKAYQELRRLRTTELQALRDLYLVHHSVTSNIEVHAELSSDPSNPSPSPTRWITGLRDYLTRYKELFIKRRLRGATISSCTVALGQQLCGINIFAFYATSLFLGVGSDIKYAGTAENERDNRGPWRTAMLFSFGFGITNLLFGIPAVGTIDTFGRRKWLLVTIPGMALSLMAAALGLLRENAGERMAVVAVFMFVHTMFYSPAMGPVPFTLASEAFPLSHREQGCSVAIFVNLLFAGLLAWFYPLIDHDIGERGGALGIFSGLNVLAFILVFLLVEETKQRNLEDLDQIYEISKRKFAWYQWTVALPWALRKAFLCSNQEKPDFYDDTTKEVTPPDEEKAHEGPRGTGKAMLNAGLEDEDGRPGSRSRYA